MNYFNERLGRDTFAGMAGQDSQQQGLSNSERIAHLLYEIRLRHQLHAKHKETHGTAHAQKCDRTTQLQPLEIVDSKHHKERHHRKHHNHTAETHTAETHIAETHAAKTQKPASEMPTTELNISRDFHDTVQRGYQSNPAHVRAELAANNYRLVAAHDMGLYDSRFHTNLSNQHPEGYKDGSTYRNAPGVFRPADNTICVPEFYEQNGKQVESRKHSPVEGIVRHEIGHAYANLRHLSGDSYVNQLYNEGLRNATEVQQPPADPQYEHRRQTFTASATDMSYYLRSGSGLHETLAELYAIEHGGGADTATRDRLLHTYFNRLSRYMQNNLV